MVSDGVFGILFFFIYGVVCVVTVSDGVFGVFFFVVHVTVLHVIGIQDSVLMIIGVKETPDSRKKY